MLESCKCGSLIDSRDGGKCDWCKAADRATDKVTRLKTQKMMDEAMKSLGLIKVKGALGGTYWE